MVLRNSDFLIFVEWIPKGLFRVVTDYRSKENHKF